MTDSDPIIAEIYLYNIPSVGNIVPVHLSDAPKVADLLEAAKNLMQVAYDGPSEPKGTNQAERYSEWRKRIEGESRAAIRAIEPEWTP